MMMMNFLMIRNAVLFKLLVLLSFIVLVENAATTTTDGLVPNSSGDPDCPCIDSTPILAQQSNCLQSDGITDGILFPDSGTCASIDYGGNGCAPYDMTEDPACFNSVTDGNGNQTSLPSYCASSWCYVDADKCRNSTKHFYPTDRLRDVYYSYSTCGYSADAWRDYVTMNALATRDTMVIALPFLEFPFHYKKDAVSHKPYDTASPEAYDDSIPWHGIVVDYFKAVVEISNIQNVELVHRSKGSQDRGYASPYTQAVSDVQVGVADMSISTFWVTTERLAMTSFTTPITVDEFTLWIPQPDFGADNLNDSIEKILMPFSKELWAATLLVIVLFTVISVIVSPEQLREFDDGEEPPKALKDKVKRVVVVLTDSLNVSMLEFFGGEVNYDNEVNYSQKLLNFSFALFIFITVAAYTANLAAFLTLSGTKNYLSSIEEATAQNIAICALYGVKDDLEALYPNANWVFHLHSNEMFEAYDRDECQVFVMGWIETRASPQYQKWICDRELVRLRNNPVMEKMIAFPVDEEIAAGFSHWIVKAESLGISFDSFISEEEALCHMEITLSNEDDEDAAMQQLTTNNLTLPLAVFGIAFTLALIIHFARTTQKSIHKNYKRDLLAIMERQNSSSSSADEDESNAGSSGALLIKQSSNTSREEVVAMICAQQQSLLRDLQQQETLLRQLNRVADGQDIDT